MVTGKDWLDEFYNILPKSDVSSLIGLKTGLVMAKQFYERSGMKTDYVASSLYITILDENIDKVQGKIDQIQSNLLENVPWS